MKSRITISEISHDLAVSEKSVYELLRTRVIPNVRLGTRWIVTRHAYEEWKRTCGTAPLSGKNERAA